MSEDMAPLLVELGTEELPPKSLQRLSKAFSRHIIQGLQDANLLAKDLPYRTFASPRRLAILIEEVALQQADSNVERRGPAVSAAFDAEGNPTPAASGFARSCKVEVSELERLQTEKGEWLVFRSQQAGLPACELIPGIVDAALGKLPIPKRMRWGDMEAEFVRPVHWLVMMHGSDVIEATLLTVASGRETGGHRFHHPGMLSLAAATDYQEALQANGHVMADFNPRQQIIIEQVNSLAAEHGGKALIDSDLLDEVTALVEWPNAMIGSFDEDYLQVPQEALISAMQDHQKYFPVVDDKGRMMSLFIFVSNIESTRPQSVIEGNERVLNARFSDARFFWDSDRKLTLDSQLERLKMVVFHNKLGSVYDRSIRVQALAGKIAELLAADRTKVERAALLAKADLLTGMVAEFPDLQGVMGHYYALEQGEENEIAEAIEQQYLPRFAGDSLPATATGQVLSIADKLDTLCGIFSIGEIPTGDKDPFALRRAALGVLRIMIELELDLDLRQLLVPAVAGYDNGGEKSDEVVELIFSFMLDRLQAYYLDKGYSKRQISSVRHRRPTRPTDFNDRLLAVDAFARLEAAPALAAANKRIQNILRKADRKETTVIDPALLKEKAERALYAQIIDLSAEVDEMFDKGDYTTALSTLASLRTVVDSFFDEVMVMDEDLALRNNRLALLERLSEMFLRTADLSQLQ
ncbi:MAG: glycine--tRNA ligase subunit beta [Pseudomonadota bacterium]|nr:glycine--tRNA ligase subunit beta [Pseudomonadota bacterium]